MGGGKGGGVGMALFGWVVGWVGGAGGADCWDAHRKTASRISLQSRMRRQNGRDNVFGRGTLYALN